MRTSGPASTLLAMLLLLGCAEPPPPAAPQAPASAGFVAAPPSPPPPTATAAPSAPEASAAPPPGPAAPAVPPGDACGKPERPTGPSQGQLVALGRYLYFYDEQDTTVRRFDLDARRWERLPPASAHRMLGSLVAVGGRAALAGGFERTELGGEGGPEFRDRVLDTIEALDTATCTWRQVAKLPHPERAAFAVLDDAVYAFTGLVRTRKYRSDPVTTVSAVSLATGKVRKLAAAPKSLQRAHDAVVMDKRIVVFGPSGETHSYDPALNTWAKLPSHGAIGTGPDGARVRMGDAILQFPQVWGPIVPEAYSLSGAVKPLAPLDGLADDKGDDVLGAAAGERGIFVMASRSRPRAVLVYQYDAAGNGWTKIEEAGAR